MNANESTGTGPGPLPSDHTPSAQEKLQAEVQRELEAALEGKSVEQLMEENVAAHAAAEAPARPADGNDPHAEFAHELVRGRITAIREDEVFVDVIGLGGKNQGVVPLTQFERPPRLGSIMEFVVERIDEAEGLTHLSREGAVSRATWEQLQRGAVVEARVVGVNKGGLELEMVGGIRAFMPASQVDMHHVGELQPFLGQKLPGMVQEIDRKSRKVILSRRHFLEAERRRAQEKVWGELEVGQTREGKVTSLAEYGAFVDIGGIDGLIHVSDLSYSRVGKPSDVLQVGQDVSVKVLKLDAEKKRISLGLKQVAPDPWQSVDAQIKAGEQLSARVLRVQDFGAFVEVLPGVEALLPASEMSWRRHQKPSDVVKDGDIVRVMVITVDAPKRRLTVSLKQSAGNPWSDATAKFGRGALVTGTVMSTTEFGAFVELEPGVEGLVHISELSDKRVNAVTDVLKVGDKQEFRVLELDTENHRIRLSLRAVKSPPPADAEPFRAGSSADAKPAAKTALRKKPSGLKSGLGDNSVLGLGLGQLKL